MNTYSSASAYPEVNYWVKAEPFTCAAIPVAPHTRLSTTNIKKIVAYAKSKGNKGFPRLTYGVWKHIACNKIQLSEDHAWTYFSMYGLIDDNPPDVRLEWDRHFTKCTSLEERDELKGLTSVPTLEFVLFLYTQHLHKISLRSSLTEEWPTRSRSPDLDGRSTPTGGKGLDEHSHMMFVLNNLNEMLEMLVEPESYTIGGSANDLTLSIEAVKALSYLIAGSVDGNKTIKSFHEIALMQQNHQKSGYSKLSCSFLFRNIQSWLRSHIGQNPFGISTCISNGKRLSWLYTGEEREGRKDNKRGRIATNALLVPRNNIKGNKIIIISQVCKQTVARMSSTLENSSVKIHRSHYSYFYLLAPMRSVSIEKSRNSTIVLGAVETVLHISNCENCIVIAACRRLIISGCHNCTIHPLTPTPSLILDRNVRITLAPYHTYYPKLEEHMTKVGLSTQPGCWDQPICFGLDHQDEFPEWTLMSPKEFYTFSIPFEMYGNTQTVPGGIPARYHKALIQRERHIENWQKAVQDAGLTKEQRKQFQGIVEDRFQEWLDERGLKSQLDGLTLHK